MTDTRTELPPLPAPEFHQAIVSLGTGGMFRDGVSADQMRSYARAAIAAQPVPVAQPVATEAQLNSACLSYRHDFGLMPPDEQERLRWSAKEWLRAWRKEFQLNSSGQT